MPPTRIKICGLTSASDASAAVAAGADALGVVLAPSPRQVTIDEAEAVFADAPSAIVRVGVFVDPAPAFLAGAVARLGLGAVQLSGSESPEFCADLVGRLVTGDAGPDATAGNPAGRNASPTNVGPVGLIKAFLVGPEFKVSVIAPYLPYVSAILLDACVAGLPGGTGRTFDWRLARDVPAGVPLIVAGGLAPENVAGAVRTLRPFAVDVSSGVESAPGIKDRRKIQSFVAAVRAADEEEPPR